MSSGPVPSCYDASVCSKYFIVHQLSSVKHTNGRNIRHLCKYTCMNVVHWTDNEDSYFAMIESVHCVLKRPVLNIGNTYLPNVNRFSKFFHCWKEDQ